MPPPSPSILLDLDGTLVDSQPGILSSCRAALRALGHAPEAGLDITAIIGPPIEEIMRLLLQPYNDDRVTEAVEAYREDYSQAGLFKSLPYSGIVQALTEINNSLFRIYLATSKRRMFAQRILDHWNLAAFFDGIHGSEPGGALDHKPELIAHVLEQHTLSPSQCIMVGDRLYDIAGAHANEVRALGVLWGYGTRDELESAGADNLVAEPADLPAAINTLLKVGVG